MKSMGIDLSLTGTGIVVLEGFKDMGKALPLEMVIEYEIKTKPEPQRFARVDKICTQILAEIEVQKPDIITIENYGVSKMQTGQIEIIELGGILRAILWQSGIKYLDPTPNELKQFIAQKVCPKDLIPMHVLHRWGHTSKTNNTADAFGLACIGLGWKGCLANMTEVMYGIVGKQKLN